MSIIADFNQLYISFDRETKKMEKKVGNCAAYLAIALSRAPKRVKTGPPSKIPETLNNANYRAYPLKIYYPNPNGGGLIDSGMTAAEYLKKIKGGYVARGSGKFMASRFKYHEARKYRDPSFKMTPGSSYAVGPGSTRVMERTSKKYLKGTGRFADSEREKLRKLRERQKEIQRQLWDADRSKSAKAYGRLVRENNRILKSLKKISDSSKGSSEQKDKARERIEANWNRYTDRLNKLREKRQARMEKWKEKHIQYRIVADSRHWGRRQTRDPQSGGLLKKGSAPGQPPKTWSGKGLTNYYIGQRENPTAELNGKRKFINNYLVEQISPFMFRVSLKPLKGSGDSTLYNLEHGGTEEGKPLIDGYVVTSRDIGSHRRVRFEIHKSKKTKAITIQKRPWFSPTLEKVRQKFNH